MKHFPMRLASSHSKSVSRQSLTIRSLMVVAETHYWVNPSVPGTTNHINALHKNRTPTEMSEHITGLKQLTVKGSNAVR